MSRAAAKSPYLVSNRAGDPRLRRNSILFKAIAPEANCERAETRSVGRCEAPRFHHADSARLCRRAFRGWPDFVGQPREVSGSRSTDHGRTQTSGYSPPKSQIGETPTARTESGPKTGSSSKHLIPRSNQIHGAGSFDVVALVIGDGISDSRRVQRRRCRHLSPFAGSAPVPHHRSGGTPTNPAICQRRLDFAAKPGVAWHLSIPSFSDSYGHVESAVSGWRLPADASCSTVCMVSAVRSQPRGCRGPPNWHLPAAR